MKNKNTEPYPLEKRLSIRFKIPGATVCYQKERWLFSKKGFDEEFCPLLDISRGGLKLASRKKLKPGNKIKLQISIPGERAPLVLLGQVRWSSTYQNEVFKFQAGIKFNVYGEKKNQNYPGNLVKIISLEQKFVDGNIDLTTDDEDYEVEDRKSASEK
ncbi:MAG: PilZ domain-containing protein [Candidatus Aminicenantes bacterium]|nr:PilZ domain-containing protein [Candidatus Aminicenantes bacterium]